MEIHGSSYPISPYSGMEPTGRYPQQAPNPPQPPQASAPIKQAVKPEANGYENRQRRFYTSDRDMSHSAKQAINNYQDTDYAAGPELMNRVDVYA